MVDLKSHCLVRETGLQRRMLPVNVSRDTNPETVSVGQERSTSHASLYDEEGHSEKHLIRQFHHSVKITEFTYTNLDGEA
jgi:hypothetical protein